MTYCRASDVLGMLKDDMINTIIGTDYIEDEAQRIEAATPIAEQAIEDACAEVDGYLGKRYSVPLSYCPPVIEKMTKDIAVYNMASRCGIDESDRENTIYVRYKNAREFLLNVAKGIVNIDDTGNGTQSASASGGALSGFRLSSNERVTSRESLKGW